MPNSQILARRFGVHWNSDAYIATAYPISKANFRGTAIAQDLRPTHITSTMMTPENAAIDDVARYQPFWRRLKRTTDDKSKPTNLGVSGSGNNEDKGLGATNATIANATVEAKALEIGKSDGDVSVSHTLNKTLEQSPQTPVSSAVLNQTIPVNDNGQNTAGDAAVPITTLQTDLALPKNESRGSIATVNATGTMQVDLTDSAVKRITETNVTAIGLNSSSNSVAAVSVPLESSVPVIKLDGEVNGCKYCVKFCNILPSLNELYISLSSSHQSA